MDPTVHFMWSRRTCSFSPTDWALELLEQGVESDAILRLTDPGLSSEQQERLIIEALRDIGRSDLQDMQSLRREYEAESISDYFAGKIDGWTLIRRGCDLFYEDESGDLGRLFWIQIADDVDGHGGQGVYAQCDFEGGAFDTVLRDALMRSGRPLRPSGPNNAVNPSGGSGRS